MRLLVAWILAAGCAPAHPAFPSGWHIIDLTHVLAPDVPTFGGKSAISSKPLAKVDPDGLYLNEVTLLEHVGTHVDAPAHFVTGGASIDQVPVERLVLQAAVIDVTTAVASNADYALTADDVRRWEHRNGALTAHHLVLVRTGWGMRWSDAARYRNPDAQGTLHFPGVSADAARVLRDRGVPAIGIDTLSIDPGPSTTFDAHKTFLGGGGYQVENVANLDKLPETGAVIVVSPLPLAGGSGSPARVIAFVH